MNVFEEGLFIPLVKLYDGGVLNQSVIDLIRWNVRTPDEVVETFGPRLQRIMSCEKICQMLKDSGMESLDDLADQVIGRTEKA